MSVLYFTMKTILLKSPLRVHIAYSPSEIWLIIRGVSYNKICLFSLRRKLEIQREDCLAAWSELR